MFGLFYSSGLQVSRLWSAGHGQYTISVEVFAPLLLSYITTLLEIVSLMAIRKTGEKHHNEIIVYSINVVFNEDSIRTA
jgi:hypothetical protein